jgi:hypothetical protein
MKTEKTMNERLKTYALHQKPYNGVESVANIDDSLDRHLPKTKPRTLVILAVCSPVLALFSWTLLIYFAIASD